MVKPSSPTFFPSRVRRTSSTSRGPRDLTEEVAVVEEVAVEAEATEVAEAAEAATELVVTSLAEVEDSSSSELTITPSLLWHEPPKE